MGKYRKKAVVIDAVQWFPPGDDRHDPSMVVHRKGNTVDPPDYRQTGDLFQFSTIKGMGEDIFMLRTLNGDVKIDPGEYIVTGVQGEKYPCKPDIFEAIHEPVDSRTQQEAFEEWMLDNYEDMPLDQLFMSTSGVPENPYEHPGTHAMYAAWLAGQSNACSSMPDPAKGVEALRVACNAIAGIPGTIGQSEWDRRVGNAIRLARQAIAACGEVTGREEGSDG